MIKRATILKHLKYHGKYERSHFTKKKGELEEICKKLGIDLTQNIDTQPVKEDVKQVIKPKKVEIQEPDSSDESSDDDEEQVPQTPLPTPVASPKVAKKLKRKQTIQKVEKVKVKSDPDIKGKVNQILKDINSVVRDLFSEFDKNEVDDVDEEYIRNEFNMILSEGQDMLDKLIVDFSDAEIQKIETKIDLQYRKLDRFLS